MAALLLQPGAPSPLPPSLQPERVVRISEAVALKISGLETISPGDVIVELNVAGQGLLKVAELRALFGLPAAATEDGPRAEEPATVAQGQQRAGGEQGGELAAERPRRLRRLLALEAVQDPGNLGTLLRCAMAFGWWVPVLQVGISNLHKCQSRCMSGACSCFALSTSCFRSPVCKHLAPLAPQGWGGAAAGLLRPVQ